jgi:hypothetical protein
MAKRAGGFAAALLLAASITTTSAGTLSVAPPAAVQSSSSAGLGAWVAGGIIAVAAFFDAYDFTRRTTCIGDPLRLGGPGFTEPLGVGNVMKPQCASIPGNPVRAGH